MRRLTALSIISTLLLLELYIRSSISNWLAAAQSHPLFAGLSMTNIRTHGVLGRAFGTDSPWLIKSVLIGTILLFAMLIFFEKPRSWLFTVGAALSVAGLAAGLADRLTSHDGAVIAYFDLTSYSPQIPVFNLQNIFFVVGILLTIIALVKLPFRKKEQEDDILPHCSRPKGGFVINNLSDFSPTDDEPSTIFEAPLGVQEEKSIEDAFDNLDELEIFEKFNPQNDLLPEEESEQSVEILPHSDNDFDFYAEANLDESLPQSPQQPQTYEYPNLIERYNQYLQKQNSTEQSKTQPQEPKEPTRLNLPQRQECAQEKLPSSNAELIAQIRENTKRLSEHLNSLEELGNRELS